MSIDLDRIETEPAERSLMPARERSRLMLAVIGRLRRLHGKTDIYSHRERAELERKLNDLRTA